MREDFLQDLQYAFRGLTRTPASPSPSRWRSCSEWALRGLESGSADACSQRGSSARRRRFGRGDPCLACLTRGPGRRTSFRV